MRYAIGTLIVVALLVGLVLPANAAVNVAGGLMLTGKVVTYTVGGSMDILQKPTVSLDLLWGPEQGQAALGIATPARTALDPLAKLCGFEWTPWAEQAMDRVCVGAAFWRTQEKFPVSGGLYFRVTALEWAF